MAAVVVVGSANVDQVFRVDRIPEPGETVLSTGFANARGGKGQNQAVAAARAGASTAFIAAIGDDGFGRLTAEGLAEDGIDSSRLRTLDGPTGTALIAVDPRGENTIIVEAGANGRLAPLDEADRSVIAAASVLVMQLEIPLETVAEAAAAARAGGTTALLNAAPIAELPDALLANLDVLVVNEHEAAHLRSSSGAAELTELVPTVVVTLGAEGAELHRRGGDVVRVPAPRVTAVDATGAGDTFCGAFAAALAEGAEAGDAVRFAVTAASLSVQEHGAVPSIPHRAAIDAALAE
ncbi:ribokinase [Antiquaquibacter soli]|uniref:Ribokinase n=1 Tax=Antiquaquibacter soli TaxID=3064523 RepID=A0ABT9BKS9_9MICO|nr:ribokinase [Protaetiibacter sp. WY-16]MDO7881625.1 ribokinase [Protaetiibacter sp. WY-16]